MTSRARRPKSNSLLDDLSTVVGGRLYITRGRGPPRMYFCGGLVTINGQPHIQALYFSGTAPPYYVNEPLSKHVSDVLAYFEQPKEKRELDAKLYEHIVASPEWREIEKRGQRDQK